MTMSSQEHGFAKTVSSMSLHSKKATPRDIMKKFEDSIETKKMLE